MKVHCSRQMKFFKWNTNFYFNQNEFYWIPGELNWNRIRYWGENIFGSGLSEKTGFESDQNRNRISPAIYVYLLISSSQYLIVLEKLKSIDPGVYIKFGSWLFKPQICIQHFFWLQKKMLYIFSTFIVWVVPGGNCGRLIGWFFLFFRGNENLTVQQRYRYVFY